MKIKPQNKHNYVIMKKLFYRIFSKKIAFALLLSFASFYGRTQVDSTAIMQEALKEVFDSINSTFEYQYGKINIGNDIATITVPDGFKFVDAEQSRKILHDLWGNPDSEDILGMILPEDMTPLHDNFTYAVEISYSEDGFIEDDDAEDIDYDELMDEMKEDAKAMNEERRKAGYSAIEIIGWAKPPFYDSENKKLHWAKEAHFEGDEENTLNYNIRILGRKGYLVLNAIGDMATLPMFEENAENIIESVEFNEGFRYSEFDPDIDKVAAYGIGGLIAGKVLAKVGFFAIFAKFFKFIAIGAVAVLGMLKGFFKKKKE